RQNPGSAHDLPSAGVVPVPPGGRGRCPGCGGLSHPYGSGHDPDGGCAQDQTWPHAALTGNDMIGRISGILLEKQAPRLLVDVAGVGYEIDVPMTTLYKLPEMGQPVVLHTHFVVREDAQLLYGFFDWAERELFRLLIKVNGVGPKMALAILSGIEGSEFVRCVQDHDINTLVRIPGVGKKTAERLLVEMQDRLKEFSQ